MLPYYIEGTIKKEEEKKACVTFSVWEIFIKMDWSRKKNGGKIQRSFTLLPGFKIRIYFHEFHSKFSFNFSYLGEIGIDPVDEGLLLYAFLFVWKENEKNFDDFVAKYIWSVIKILIF